MKEPQSLPFKNHMLLYPLIMVFAIWLVFWVEIRWDVSFNTWGVHPRTVYGLRGILFSPFIHGDATHLWHNTLPLFILSTALFYFYEYISLRVLLIGFLLTGLFTWFIGRDSYHIGASGIIYMLFGFLFLKGLIAKHFRLLAVSFFVVFVYGGMIWYVAPIETKISWEGHLSGLLAGFLLALSQKRKVYEKPKYVWESDHYNEETDEFMKCFDENGNFIPTPPKITEEFEKETPVEIISNNIRLIYHKVDKKRNLKRKYNTNN